MTQVSLNLESSPGSGLGDGSADSVIVNGTNAADNIEVVGSGSSYSVTGLPASVSVSGSEGANDSLVVNALGGNDGVTATTWWLLLFYSIAASMVTVWLWMTGLKHVPASSAGVFTVFLPVTAAAVGAFFYGEEFTTAQAAA